MSEPSVTVNALPDTYETSAVKDNAVTDGASALEYDTNANERKEQSLDGQGRSEPKYSILKPKRPGLQREKSVTLSQQAPPPLPPPHSQDVGNAGDSLSLVQLKKLVADTPKVEQAPYAFTYEDTNSFEEEVEELFSYGQEEQSCLLQARWSFDRLWASHVDISETQSDAERRTWLNAEPSVRKGFLNEMKSELLSEQMQLALMALTYLALGCWYETASRLKSPLKGTLGLEQDTSQPSGSPRFQLAEAQVACMQQNIRLIAEEIGPQAIFDSFRMACVDEFDDDDYSPAGSPTSDEAKPARWASLVLLCLLADAAGREPANITLREQIIGLEPDLLAFLTQLLADLRWSDTNALPSIKVLVLYWKVILLKFGGTHELAKTKTEINAPDEQHRNTEEAQMYITASPLDYHVFRQEITSKYPAFRPPPPLFPFQPGYDSMLPSIDERLNRFSSAEEEHTIRGPASVGGRSSSIISQPVHIATPAPSPPPSPAGPGGKGVKKQNYQTNQMFPMLYPPMDETSNNLGGKGSSEKQDLLVSRKWQGSDIPCSILEAAEIFSKRMRAGRGMKQLWQERVRFLEHERGGKGYSTKAFSKVAAVQRRQEEQEDIDDVQDTGLRKSLEAVECFYKEALPHLQSVVLVLSRVLLQTVTTLVTQPGVPNGSPSVQQASDQNGLAKADVQEDIITELEKPIILSTEDVDVARSHEIMNKAVSAILMLLLKWFKLSHILKFEHLSQLLLDANYLQIVLKQFTHQDLERTVRLRTERKDFNFFRFCQHESQQGMAGNQDGDFNNKAVKADQPIENGGSDTEPEPEFDRFAPIVPITNFSWRVIFTTINHLRVMQKIISRKSHRQLLMVQYKSSTTLKKCLKIAQPDLRVAALKCIKGQVPYCHRKWRQGNMRTITAIYLHCKPTLRDEWLAGVDVDQELSEALPQEQALRALTAWFHARRYPSKGSIEDEKEGQEEERDFFADELDKMDFRRGDGPGEEEGFQTDEEDGRWEGPIQVEEWLTSGRR